MKSIQDTNHKIVMPFVCDKEWNNMQATELGKFCLHCSKEVIDFTNMSDEQLILYLQSNQVVNGCGRFRKKQIDRIQISVHDDVDYYQFTSFQKFLFAFLFFFGVQMMQIEMVMAASLEQHEINQPKSSSTDTTNTETNVDSSANNPSVTVEPVLIPNTNLIHEQVFGGAFMIIPQSDIPKVLEPTTKSTNSFYKKNDGNSNKKITHKKTQTPIRTKRVAK